MEQKDIELAAYSQESMPKNLLDSEKCMYLFLRCLYRDYKDNNITLINAEKEKNEFTFVLNRVLDSKKMFIDCIKRWNKCEYLLSEIEKSTCNICNTCELCRKVARIIDGREN